jgi:parallel beta-helix repeat protein
MRQRRIAWPGAWALAIVIALCIPGCGGSSGGAAPPSPPLLTAPVLTGQPAAATATVGGTASFSVAASGSAPLAYQWQKNGTPIPGATAASYTTPALALADSGATYGVVVSNGAGTVNSELARLTVTAIAPTLDAQPVAATATVGAGASFSAHATGMEPLAYQWFRSGIAIPGATASSLSLGAVRYGDDAVAYTVEVSNTAGTTRSQAAVLSVSPATPATMVAACTELTTPGSYRLNADLATAASQASCISIHDVQDIQLDCAGHRIAGEGTFGARALAIRNVRNFSIRNCVLSTSNLDISDSSVGSFSQNTLFSKTVNLPNAVINVWHGSTIVFDNNTIAGSMQQFYSVGNTVSNNHVTAAAGANSVAGTVISNWGIHDRIIGNSLEGSWTGSGCCNGADDGIILTDNDDAVVENNTINNVWDCGIEWVGTLTRATIRGNRVVNAANCAVGGWYWASLSDSVIANNTAEKSATLFSIFRVYGLRPAGTDSDHRLPADTAVVFTNNLFEGNILKNPSLLAAAGSFPLYSNVGYSGLSTLPGERAPGPGDYQLKNNVFRNNQFSTDVEGPGFGTGAVIPGAVVDGGGNICKTPTREAYPYPLKCG